MRGALELPGDRRQVRPEPEGECGVCVTEVDGAGAQAHLEGGREGCCLGVLGGLTYALSLRHSRRQRVPCVCDRRSGWTGMCPLVWTPEAPSPELQDSQQQDSFSAGATVGVSGCGLLGRWTSGEGPLLSQDGLLSSPRFSSEGHRCPSLCSHPPATSPFCSWFKSDSFRSCLSLAIFFCLLESAQICFTPHPWFL